MAKPAPSSVSVGDKCGDACDKIGTICKVVGAVACGSLKMKTVKIGSSDAKTFKKLTPCLGDYIKTFFQKYSNKHFLCTETERYTYKQCLSMYESVGAELRAGFGVNVGESVGCCMKNMPEFVLGFLGAVSVGCRGIPLNSLNTSAELEYAMTDAECKVVFCDEQRMALISPFADKIGCKIVLCESKDEALASKHGAILWEKVVSDGKSKPKPDTSQLTFQSDSMIMYTSGSTGKPKGVVHSTQSLGTAIGMQELANLATKDDAPKSILAVPLFHITGLTLALGAFVGGQEVHMLRKWDAGKALDIIEREKITRFVGVPTMVRDMFEHKDFSVKRMASIKMLAGGGSAMPPALMAKMAEVTGKSSGAQGYGLTETCGGVIIAKGLETLKFPDSTGKPIPLLVKACIKDPATGKKITEPNTRGELCILSAMNMTRYHNRQEDTDKVVDSEGWFHSGDVAEINSGGYIFIRDRLKDIIIRGGENIDCIAVETAVYTMPKIRECSVFGVPDARLGEEVGLAVYSQDPVTPEEVNQFLKTPGLLPAFMIPKAINIWIHTEELPKGATHKIDRKGMREKYAEEVKARGSTE